VKRISFLTVLIIILAVTSLHAENLVLPVFAHNVEGADGVRWSSEIYLTNPSHQPVQVALVRLLPGYVNRPAPCDLFMPPTRVVPPRSAVVWTSEGLAVDLGCAEEALGALILSADGPVDVSSRMVSHREGEPTPHGVLVGQGQEVPVLSFDEIPSPGDYMLPALSWRSDGWTSGAFDTYAGFANPGAVPVIVTLEVPEGHAEGEVVIDGVGHRMPASFEVPANAWIQVRLRMRDSEEHPCTGPENFDLMVGTDGLIAMYASVVDRSSNDARTVAPVAFD